MTTERVFNVRHRCDCGRFVRRASITTSGYDCTACGRRPGRPVEEVSGEASTVDVLFVVPAPGHVAADPSQEQFDLYYAADPDRVLGPSCAPLKCPVCGRFSAESWTTPGQSTPSGFWQEWGGVCRRHGRWADSA